MAASLDSRGLNPVNNGPVITQTFRPVGRNDQNLMVAIQRIDVALTFFDIPADSPAHRRVELRDIANLHQRASDARSIIRCWRPPQVPLDA